MIKSKPELSVEAPGSIGSETDARPSLGSIGPAVRWFQTRGRFRALIAGLIVALPVSILVAVGVGATSLEPGLVARIIGGHLLPSVVHTDWSPTNDQIVWDLRVPRTLLAAVVGAGLAVTGAILQAVVRNTLADPYLLGVSSGAGVGALIVIAAGAALVASWLAIGAVIGAFVSALAVFALSQRRGRLAPTRLVLAGVAMSYLLVAVQFFLILVAFTSSGGVALSALHWLLGSLGSAGWSDLPLTTLVIVVVTVVLMAQARPLNAILLGEESATSLGVNVNRLRIQTFALAALLTGTAVAVSGAVLFFGLVIPHIVRILVGADHRRLLPAAALTGAVFLVWTDALSRVLIAPSELPLSIITALVGAPFFLWLMRREGATGMAR